MKSNIKSTSIKFYKKLRNLQLTRKQFILIKDELKRKLLSRRNLVPKLRAFIKFFSLVLKHNIPNEKIISEIDNISYEEIIKYTQKLYKKLYLISFAYGDITKSETKSLFKKVVLKRFSGLNKLKNVKNYHADLNGYYIFREKQDKSFNLNHAILNFYQIGKNSIKSLFISNLIKSLCGYIYFTQLRIKEQLGYTTKGKVFSNENILVNLVLV